MSEGFLRLLHLGCGAVLIVSHGYFLIHGLVLRRQGRRPGRLDKLARTLSHLGLPAVLATGAAMMADGPRGPAGMYALHILLGILPIVLIIFFTPLLSLKRRIPWLLPTLNGVLFLGAGVVGLLLGRLL